MQKSLWDSKNQEVPWCLLLSTLCDVLLQPGIGSCCRLQANLLLYSNISVGCREMTHTCLLAILSPSTGRMVLHAAHTICVGVVVLYFLLLIPVLFPPPPHPTPPRLDAPAACHKEGMLLATLRAGVADSLCIKVASKLSEKEMLWVGSYRSSLKDQVS